MNDEQRKLLKAILDKELGNYEDFMYRTDIEIKHAKTPEELARYTEWWNGYNKQAEMIKELKRELGLA